MHRICSVVETPEGQALDREEGPPHVWLIHFRRALKAKGN